MDGYRLFFLDEDGRINRGVELECLSDEEAIQAAEQYRDGLDLELWQRNRVVKKIPKLRKG